jgi:hypothetical protein
MHYDLGYFDLEQKTLQPMERVKSLISKALQQENQAVRGAEQFFVGRFLGQIVGHSENLTPRSVIASAAWRAEGLQVSRGG